MPTHKGDLRRLNITQIAQLVKAKPQTVRRKLDGLKPVQVDGREMLFDSAVALQKFYLGESIDLSREREKLAREQTAAARMRNEREAGEWGRWKDFDETLSR